MPATGGVSTVRTRAENPASWCPLDATLRHVPSADEIDLKHAVPWWPFTSSSRQPDSVDRMYPCRHLRPPPPRAFATRVEHAAAPDGREQERQVERLAEHTGAKVDSGKRDRRAAQRHTIEGEAVVAKRALGVAPPSM
jgi:hypothetical protein